MRETVARAIRSHQGELYGSGLDLSARCAPLLRRRECDAAIELVRSTPGWETNANAFLQIGTAMLLKSDDEVDLERRASLRKEAEAAYLEADKLAARSGEARVAAYACYDVGRLRFQEQAYAEADTWFERAARRCPDFADADQARIAVACARTDLGDAEQEQAIRDRAATFLERCPNWRDVPRLVETFYQDVSFRHLRGRFVHLLEAVFEIRLNELGSVHRRGAG